jgi:SecD/SecF fusion protein
MKPFFWKIVLCLIPNILAAWVVWHSLNEYAAGTGGPKLGVDLVGGTILVYEIDPSKQKLDTGTAFDPTQQKDSKLLATYLKKRIDPNDLYNIVVRMVGDTRVEIILPTGGKHRSELAQKAWDDVIEKVKKEWSSILKPADDKKDAEVFDVGQGRVQDLADRIKQRIEEKKWPALLGNPKKPEIWKSIVQLAENHFNELKTSDIKPGDYATLIQRVALVRKAVEDVTNKAQQEAWKETIARIEEYLKKIKWEVPELNPIPKPEEETREDANGETGRDRRLRKIPGGPQRRGDLIRYIQSKGNPFAEASIQAVEPMIDSVELPGGPKAKDIADLIDDAYGPSADAIRESIDKYYKASDQNRDVTAEYIQQVKDLIAKVGKLEFLILANNKDDQDGADKAQEYLKSLGKEKLEEFAKHGQAPPGPRDPSGRPMIFEIRTARGATSQVSYSWVEIGWRFRASLGLQNKARGSSNWLACQRARDSGELVAKIPDARGGEANGFLFIYSREVKNQNLTEEQRKDKQYEYFVLARDPEIDEKGELVAQGTPRSITGYYLIRASRSQDRYMQPSVAFELDQTGGALFKSLTGKNIPNQAGQGGEFFRHLAIVLDGEVMSAPTINSEIENRGEITGGFTVEEVNRLVNVLRSGALPATLKGQPVSENTMGATLGQDTIDAGVTAVGIAFAAILVFMLVYYKFSGLVACVALLSNLLLTVGFMIAVQATFTLPGLAGLVLMLGMAVDANVLIYERLREERDRGASLALAIRNGYDRAFPTIIDTHLTSIFTAIVLYVVGNDQLKGFGVSLTVGLIISLFTSLYVTRLIFDLWLSRGWLKKLSMFRLLSKPRIDFMAIRYYWFTATILLTVIGVAVFVLRGEQGWNIDFVGGTAYTGKLKEPQGLDKLREDFSDERQKEHLQVEKVREILDHTYEITYKNPSETRTIYINDPPPGERAEREAAIKARAEQLPDSSLVQIFSSDDTGGKTALFTVRTPEKEFRLVQASVDRLLRDKNGKSLLEKVNMSYAVPHKKEQPGAGVQAPVGPTLAALGGSPWTAVAALTIKPDAAKKASDLITDATLTFTDEKGEKTYASPSFIKTVLDEALKTVLAPVGAKSSGQAEAIPFTVTGTGESKESRYKTMNLTLTKGLTPEEMERVLAAAKKTFNERPQPERLENFDKVLAGETQGRAILAILLSWGAILLYLWFRFGSWTFGLAAVLCLIHDLFFTLGLIGIASYVHGSSVGSFLLLEDFRLDLTGVAALLTLVGYSVSDTIVVFDRIREVRGKNPDLTPQMINDSVNQTLSRTLLTAFSVWLVVTVLYIWGGQGVHLFSFVMVIGVIVGTYSSIYIASPLLLIFGEGARGAARARLTQPRPGIEPAT